MNNDEKIELIKVILNRWDNSKVCPYCGYTLNAFLPEAEQLRNYAGDYCKICDDCYEEYWHQTFLAIIGDIVFDRKPENDIRK